MMKTIRPYRYLLSCFLLVIPILVWNIVFTQKLAGIYHLDDLQDNIPAFITYGENISRIFIFVLMFFMPLTIATPVQKKGLLLFIAGTVIYFLSWVLLMYLPGSVWSNSMAGFMAPAYTPLLWLLGIGLIGDTLIINLPYRRWMFILSSVIFLIFHNTHIYLVYCNCCTY